MANSILFEILQRDTPITSKFGTRSAPVKGASTTHTAVDVGVPVGTPIYAPEDGILTGNENSKGGVQAFIKGGSGYRYGFAHMSRRAVPVGSQVKKGQIIGYTGNTGIGTGAHLHFTVTDPTGQKINPETFKSPTSGGQGLMANNIYTPPNAPIPLVNIGGQLAAPENKQEFDLFSEIAGGNISQGQEPILANAASAIAQAQKLQQSVSLLNTNPLQAAVSSLFDAVETDG